MIVHCRPRKGKYQNRNLAAILVVFFIHITQANARHDQFVMPGCQLITVEKKVIQQCGEINVPEIVFNDPNRTYFDESIKGDITGAKSVGLEGMYWVQEPSKILGNDGVKVCGATTRVTGVKEECKFMLENSTGTLIGINGSVIVKKVRFDSNTDGSDGVVEISTDNTETVSTDVHRNGYISPHLGKECPYKYAGSGTEDETNCKSINSTKPGLSKKNNCYLYKDSIVKGCMSEDKCPCNIGQCNSSFQPTNQNIPNDVKNCYNCHAAARMMMKNCLEKGDNNKVVQAYNNAGAYIKSIISNAYGDGLYICAFTREGSKSKRIGCIKTINGIGPRPFPRIAMADEGLRFSMYPAAHLFLVSPYVEQFRDTDQRPDACNENKAEMGESMRGTFFRPKIRIRLADNHKILTFTPRTGASMQSVYGTTNFVKGQSAYSGWNEVIPVAIESAQLNRQTCELRNTKYKTYICTRLEYSSNTGIEEYVAYYARSLTNQSAVSIPCSGLSASNMLIRIGSVRRPMLKYKIDTNDTPVLPLKLSIVNVDRTIRYPIAVTLDPSNVPTDIPGYHNNLTSMSIQLTPTRFHPIDEKIVHGRSCGLLFNHKVCIEEEECTGLDYVDERTKDKSDLETCVTTDCKLYKSLRTTCEQKTYCNPGYLTKANCQDNVIQAKKLKLEKDFGKLAVQNQWQPSACITSESFFLPSVEQRKLFGIYGNPSVEHGIELVYPADPSGPGNRLIRTFEKDNDRIITNIMPVSNSYFDKHDIMHVVTSLRSGLYQHADALNVEYFGEDCDTDCIKGKINIRRRNMRELGGCVDFTYADSAEAQLNLKWAPKNTSSSMGTVPTQVSDTYIPLGCRYLDVVFQGAGGGGSKPSDGMSIGFQNDGYGVSSGSTGGIGVLVLDAMSNGGVEFLRIIRSNAGYKHRIGCYTWYGNAQGFTTAGMYDVYGGVGILTKNQQIAIGYSGKGNIDLGSSCYYGGTGWIPGGGANLNRGYFKTGRVYEDGTDLYLSLGVKNGTNAHAGKIGPGSYGGDQNRKLYNMFGKDEYGASGAVWSQCHSWFVNCWSRGWNVTKGKQGGAILQPARTIKSSDGTVRFRRDQDLDSKCISMCPRMNIEMTVGTKKVVCEYGGVIANKLGELSDTIRFSSQVPVGGYAMPTHCVDDDGRVYIPNSDMGLQKCVGNTQMYTGNHKLYGVCASSNSSNAAIKSITMSNDNRIIGAGTYCDRNSNNECHAIRYWDAEDTRGMYIEPKLTSTSRFGRKCLPNGLWAKDVGLHATVPINMFAKANYGSTVYNARTVNKLANNLLHPDIKLFCPRIDPGKVPYNPLYTLNAFWRQTPSNSKAQIEACLNGFVPYALNQRMVRNCSVFGTWGGLDIGSDKPCLYACQTITDTENAIRWDPPTSYSNPKSLPICMPTLSIVYRNGRRQMAEVTTRLMPGVNPLSLARTCNIPARSDPLRYAGVSPENPMGKLPSWAPPPANAKCISSGYIGECIARRYACYDSAHDGEDTIGFCQGNTVYKVNGINISPPVMRVNNGIAEDYDSPYAYIKAQSAEIECMMDRNAIVADDLKTSLPFEPSNTMMHGDIQFNCASAKVMSNIPILQYEQSYSAPYVQNLGTASTDQFGEIDAKLAMALESNIVEDIAHRGENCLLPQSDVLYDRIAGVMSSYGLCSFACFDDKVEKFVKYSCTDQISKTQDTAQCAQICSTDPQKLYFSYASGLVRNKPKGKVWEVTTANDQHCVNNGISIGLINVRSTDPSVKYRVGKYCNKVFFRANGNLEKGILKTSINNSLFEGKYDSSQKQCWLGRQCTLPNGRKMKDQEIDWMVIADESIVTDEQYRLQYTSIIQPETNAGVGNNGSKYLATAKNIFFFKLGCVDGQTMLLDVSEPINYTLTIAHRKSELTKEEHVKYAISINAVKIAEYTDMLLTQQKIDALNMDLSNPIGYYLSLSRLQKKGRVNLENSLLDIAIEDIMNEQASLPYVSSQVQDYATMPDGKAIKAIFSNLDTAANVKIKTPDNLTFALEALTVSPPSYGFAKWVKRETTHSIKFVDNGWEITEINASTNENVRIDVGDSQMEKTEYILDDTSSSGSTSQNLQKRWSIMCSPNNLNCVIRNLLTGKYISPAKENQTVKVLTDDIGRAQRFTISN